MKELRNKKFTNGIVYCLETYDGFLIETTDTFLPYYTKNCQNNTNVLYNTNIGSRSERYMVGVSVGSGCPIGCKFCATGLMKKFRNLTADEIVEQVDFVTSKNTQNPLDSQEFKINYTRMSDTFINVDNVKEAIHKITTKYPNTHHYVSTVGIKGSDFSWIKDNITLQISLHSLDEERRHELIPINNLMSIEELGQIRTNSNLKTTVNLTLVDEKDFDIEKLKKYFNPEYFFIKISPINKNVISEKNGLGDGIIKGVNLV